MKNINFKTEGTTLQRYLGTDKHIIIPEGITELGDEAFECNSIAEIIEIPSTVKDINAWPFFDCNNLRNIVINNDNPYITKTDGCIYSKDKTKLLLYPPYIKDKIFTIPSFVKKIESTAFYGSSAEKVICNSGLEIIGEGAFFSSINLKEIYISDTVSEIGAVTFCNCKSLLRINIPNGIKIHPSAFEGCGHLIEINFSG